MPHFIAFRATKSNVLSKKEKDTVQQELSQQIGPYFMHKNIFDYIKYCRMLEKEGMLGMCGIPWRRFMPYLQAIIKEQHPG